MRHRFVGANVVLVLALWATAGCAFVAAGPTGLPPAIEPSGQFVSDLELSNGHSLTLRITEDEFDQLDGAAVRNRCWALSESDPDGTIVQTIGACTRGDDVATHVGVDATVLLTSCSSTSIAVGPSAEALTAEFPALSGVVLIPAAISDGQADSIAYACVDADGARPPVVVVDLP